MRGYFFESYNKKQLLESGIDYDFVQDNQSYSTKGVLRGMHYQINHPQTKLVRVIYGLVYDVAVDLRKDSSTYMKWHGVYLSGENNVQFLIPEGFAHGFLVLSDEAVFSYKVTDFYHKDDEGQLLWNDKQINIKWPNIITSKESSSGYSLYYGTELILSNKDINK